MFERTMNVCRVRKGDMLGNAASWRAIDWTRVRRLGRVTPNTYVQFSCGYRSLSVKMNKHSSDFGVS